MEIDSRIQKIIALPITKTNVEIGKGYNQQALAGLLQFLEALYEDLLHDIDREGLDPLDAIKSELAEIDRLKKNWL